MTIMGIVENEKTTMSTSFHRSHGSTYASINSAHCSHIHSPPCSEMDSLGMIFLIRDNIQDKI